MKKSDLEYQDANDPEYQHHMDILANKISHILDNETLEDAALVCAACLGFALREMWPEIRKKNKPIAMKLMNKIISAP